MAVFFINAAILGTLPPRTVPPLVRRPIILGNDALETRGGGPDPRTVEFLAR